jgi:hypothetical protein
VNGAIYQLKRYLESHGDSGKDEINSVCTTHIVTLLASTSFNYCGCDIKSGRLRLLFHPNQLGTNIDNAASKLADAVSAAPQPAGAPVLSFAARHAVKTDYEPKIIAILEKCATALQNPTLKFEPGFEELGKMLKGGKDVRDDWERNLGDFAQKYYESFLSVLVREKFGEDDMLREGFAEGVPEGIVRLRLVDELKSGYNELVLDGGALVMQVSQVLLSCTERLTVCRRHQPIGVLTLMIRRRSW